jgi:hypothetical protein
MSTLHPLQIQGSRSPGEVLPAAADAARRRPRPVVVPKPAEPARAAPASHLIWSDEYGPWIQAAPPPRWQLLSEHDAPHHTRSERPHPGRSAKWAASAPRLVQGRQIFCWLAKRYTSESFPSMGRALGGRHHTTTLHAERRVEQQVLPLVKAPAHDTPAAWAEALLSVKWPTGQGRPNMARRSA